MHEWRKLCTKLNRGTKEAVTDCAEWIREDLIAEDMVSSVFQDIGAVPCNWCGAWDSKTSEEAEQTLRSGMEELGPEGWASSC